MMKTLALSPHYLRKYGVPENLVVGGATSKPVVSELGNSV